MPSLEQNKIAMNDLIKKANRITGKNDADLTSAINSLIEGYGKGGTSGIPEGYYYLKESPVYEVKQNQTKVDVTKIGCRYIYFNIPVFDPDEDFV